MRADAFCQVEQSTEHITYTCGTYAMRSSLKSLTNRISRYVAVRGMEFCLFAFSARNASGC